MGVRLSIAWATSLGGLALAFVACGADGGSAASGGGAGSSASGKPDLACGDDTAIVVAGQATGFASCAGGILHRGAAMTCANGLPRTATCDAAGGFDVCTSDADCTEAPRGFCTLEQPPDFGPPDCGCHFGCIDDDECGVGAICLCGDPVGTCVPASCKTDDDCGAGFLCTSYREPGCTVTAFACQTPEDDCFDDSDCDAYDELCSVVDARRTCVPANCDG